MADFVTALLLGVTFALPVVVFGTLHRLGHRLDLSIDAQVAAGAVVYSLCLRAGQPVWVSGAAGVCGALVVAGARLAASEWIRDRELIASLLVSILAFRVLQLFVGESVTISGVDSRLHLQIARSASGFAAYLGVGTRELTGAVAAALAIMVGTAVLVIWARSHAGLMYRAIRDNPQLPVAWASWKVRLLATIIGGGLLGLSVPSVSVTENGWLEPGVTLPLPDDAIYCTQAAKPDARLLTLAKGHEVIFDASFGLSPALGHSLKYHTACKAFVWQASPDDVLTPALLISADKKILERCKTHLRRCFVSYAYGEAAGKTLCFHYPLFYRASDEFIPCIEKDVMKSVTGKDGEKEWVKMRVPLDGVPHCRIRRTMIVTQTDGGYISLDRNAGSAQVVEEFDGVTSTRREVTFHLLPSEYTAEAFIARDFTDTQANKLPEFRSFFAAQKGQQGHPVAFGTHSKGYFGLRQTDDLRTLSRQVNGE